MLPRKPVYGAPAYLVHPGCCVFLKTPVDAVRETTVRCAWACPPLSTGRSNTNAILEKQSQYYGEHADLTLPPGDCPEIEMEQRQW